MAGRKRTMARRKRSDHISRRQARDELSPATLVPPSPRSPAASRPSPIRLPSSTAGLSASHGTATTSLSSATPGPSKGKEKDAGADVGPLQKKKPHVVLYDMWADDPNSPKLDKPFADVGPEHKFSVEFEKIFCRLVITSDSDDEVTSDPVPSGREETFIVRQMAEKLRRAIKRKLQQNEYGFDDEIYD